MAGVTGPHDRAAVVPSAPRSHDQALAPPWTRRIGTRLTALVAVTTFGCFAVAVLLGLEVQERHLIRQAVDGAALFGDSITRATHDQMLRGQKEEAYRVIEEIGSLEPVEKVRLLNKQGQVKFSTDEGEIGAVVTKQAEICNSCHGPERTLVETEVPERARVFRTGDHRVLGFVTPVYNEPSCVGLGCHAHEASQRVLGVVDVAVTLAPVDREIASLRWRTLGIGFLGTLVLTGLIFLATRRFILKPVRSLVAATREIAEGDLDRPARRQSDDELGLLAESFDGMRVSLKGARAEIESLMSGLERQVEERTAALKRAQAQLVQGEKLASLGKLSASIAHEINNPLAGILTFSKLLSRDLDEDPVDASTREEALKRLRLIQRETERCSAIVRNLLDFARQRATDLREVDVSAALEESIHLVAHQVELQGLKLEKRIEQSLVARADFGQLRQAFVNILLNAVEAMSRGGVLTVVAETSPSGGEAVVSISDTGVGIDEEHVLRIFDPFFTTKEKGTGLGLSVVYGIVDGIGGKLEVDSRPGAGTTVRIRLPLAVDERHGADSVAAVESSGTA